MKKIFFLVFSVLMLYFLFNNNAIIPDNFYFVENKEQVIGEMEAEEFNSGVKINSTFFNVEFGMTKQEVEEEFKKMVNENIINDVNTQFGILGASYIMNYHEYSNAGKVYCFFNENKLTELQIDTLCNGKNLLELFIKKYGDADFLADNYGNVEYHWVKGNRHVTIIQSGVSDKLLIQYLDTTEKLKENSGNLFRKWGLFPVA